MKFQKAYLFEKERGLYFSDKVPLPQKVLPGHLLIRIMGTSICGTDIQILKKDAWTRENVFPHLNGGMVLGHEFYGKVVKKGSGTKTKLGSIGACESHYPSPESIKEKIDGHTCPNYGIFGVWGHKINEENRAPVLGGAFAEYIMVPESNFYHVKDLYKTFPCSLIEPSGNTWAIIEDLRERGLPESMLIFGAGPHGINLQVFGQYFGVKRIVVVEPDDYRRGFSRGLGAADAVVKPQDIEHEEFDAVFDMVGYKSIIDVVLEKGLIKENGIFGLFGLPKEKDRIIETKVGNFDMSKFIFEKMEAVSSTRAGKEFRYIGYTGRTDSTLKELIKALQSDKDLQDKLKRPLRLEGPLDRLDLMLKAGFPDIFNQDDLKIGFNGFKDA
jgi:threonine dehydrogenase-like Zn-dependent dehydrogenase